MSLIRISESDDWIVDYDRERGMYRVSYFEDGHFKDEHWFDCYEEKEIPLVQALENRDYKVFKNTANIEDYTFEQVKAAIDDFNKMVAESAKSDKEMYEEHAFEMLTNWHRE